MNFDLFISSPQYNEWCMMHLDASREEDFQIQKLVQSSAFKNWLQQNPDGTVDQYLQALHAYRQTPEYQIRELQSEVYYLTEEVDELNNQVADLQEEIRIKNNEIQSLTSTNTGLLITSIFLFVATITLLVMRKKNFFKK